MKMFSVPSVTMNGGSRNLVTRKPFIAPAASPTTSPRRSASGAGAPLPVASCATTMEARIMTAPTERSMPAVRMMSVWAMARVPTTETCWVIRDRFSTRRNLSLSSPKTTTATSRTMAGLRAG
jgi:hypothetical protein